MYKGKEITLCVPTLNRYDLLMKLIESAEQGNLKPDKYLIIDNGGNLLNVFRDFFVNRKNITIYTPERNIGVAASWNYFIDNAPEIRIISNDDILFYKNSLDILLSGPENTMLCSNEKALNSFSLYVLPDYVVDTTGKFDETISPNWGYFEDNDFHYRMRLAGLDFVHTDAYVGHFGSATLKNLTFIEQLDHHRKFEIAKANYIKKWGDLPGKEKFITPYGK